MPRARPLLTVLLSLIAVYTLLHYLFPRTQLCPPLDALTPANATLGFSTILAVSHSRSPRRPSLLWAANLTDLDIVIPEQPAWTIGDIEDFRAREGSSISSGSAKAWLGHLFALRCFLNSDHETALILEDDTDFDLSIRHSQVPLLASAIRSLLTNASTTNDASNFWSPTSNWDILYPGHCDDLPSPPAYLAQPHLAYHDPSVPALPLMHPDTAYFLSTLNIPPQTRFLHRAYWPFCTFAYAVNRRSAAAILESMAREPEGGSSAFDVELLSACQDRGWSCWSVAPELFHHGVGASEIFRTDHDDGDGLGEGEVKRSGRGTWNVGCGARHGQLWVGEEDAGRRREMKSVVRGAVKRGECPVDKVAEERSWTGCEWGGCGAQS
ncbi:hypothetical protein BDW02DRAFT_548305 [Decorospora gaudefroyi]|uniref:Glycosyltransferase family 25 protein n=1 Tax=Decorospora gaudefroyi TaxID=184978 RepID=A0A6A5KLX2_9PLEO|nr:hypothetical protein BDW02DRAFT_548305 [Decorospora gaudefroyi]